MRASLSILLAAFLVSCANPQHTASVTTGGNAQRGKAAIARYGCGSCHQIPGISGAVGLAGPPLSGIASRFYVAGVMPNTPENMIRWIEHPKEVDEKTLMPDLGVTPEDATDIAGYLYTLK
ncbi:MAG TPA: c-type cytochrome [Bryobacteraceae bacterium]|jgi:cytochrome c2|nr:c-type cytochrome [Bryobacteraceae bacterium]